MIPHTTESNIVFDDDKPLVMVLVVNRVKYIRRNNRNKKKSTAKLQIHL